MGKNLNFVIMIIFTIGSIVGVLYLADILFIQIPSNTFVSSHGYGILYGFIVSGAFTVIGIWALINQTRLWKMN